MITVLITMLVLCTELFEIQELSITQCILDGLEYTVMTFILANHLTSLGDKSG